jgi:hypothetical protein
MQEFERIGAHTSRDGDGKLRDFSDNVWKVRSPVMSEELQQLIDAARRRPFSEDEREAQRRSFAYGNTHIENERVTREMVDQLADELNLETQTR